LVDTNNEDVIGGTSSTYTVDEMDKKFSSLNPQERGHLEYAGVNGRMLLKLDQ